MLCHKDTIEMAHFLLDVLFVQSRLSLVAQTVTATVADVHATLLTDGCHGEVVTDLLEQTRVQIWTISSVAWRVDSLTAILRWFRLLRLPASSCDLRWQMEMVTKHYGPVMYEAGVGTDSVERVGTAQEYALQAVP